MVAIAKAKDKGGRYYLDPGVLSAAGKDFYSRGSLMRADVATGKLPALVQALSKAGAKFTAPAEFDASKVVKAEDAGKMARVESAPKVARVDDTMRAKIKEIVRRQAGPHVNLEFLDRLDLAPGELARSSGGDPAAVPSGFFDPYENLIAIATGTLHPEESAYHEAMHYLEAAGVFTPQEAALMRASRGSMEKYLSRSIDPERLARMPQHELNAYASEAYQKERDAGEPLHTAGAGLHIGIKRAFEKLRRFWEAILNAAKGFGFETWRDVIDRQRSGELAGRVRPEDQGSNAAAMLNEKGRMARVERRRAAVEPSRGERLAKGWNTLIENVQNLHLPKRDLQAELEARKGEELPDQHAFYERARLYPGRRAAQIEDFNRDLLDPLIATAKKARISHEEADDYVYALHAEERNERIDAINPAAQGMGSGMSDEEARAIIERVEADPRRAEFERIADLVQRMRHFEIDTRENAGLISEPYAEELRDGYKSYVPLSGFADETDPESRYLGAGKFAVRGKEHEQALGRLSKANSPIENMVNQAYQAIGRAERNRVVDSLARALKSLGKENVADIVSFDKGEPKRIIDPKTGLVTWVDDSSFRFSPNAVPYKVGGKTRYLVFKDARLAEAMKRSAPDELNDVLRHVLRATNEIKSLWTHYSPNFLIRHFLFRYPIEGAMNFFEAKEANPDASVLRFMAHSAPFLGPAYKAIRAVQSGERGGAWGDLYNEMRQHGGMVGLAAMRDIDAEFKNLRSEMAGWTKNANPLRLRRAFIRAMSTATSALDNSIRLAAYKQFREGGMSPQKASLRARDATVDFQLKGRKADWMGLIWPFANVAIQTGVRLTGATARSRMIRRAALGMMLSGLLLGAANYLLAGKDDDGEYFFDKVPDWEKRLNLIVMTGRKDERLHIPMPYNWAFPMVAGYALANTIFGNKSVRKQLGMVTKSALELVTPVGQEENPIAMFAPEVVRPAIHVRTNESWNGNPVHTESKFQKGPNSMNGRDSTGEAWKALARGVNSATGGSIASKGVVDMYPEDYRHIFDEVIGAQRRLIGGLSETVSDAKAGREFKPGGVPGLSVVYGKGDAKLHDRSAYYEERSHIQAARDEVDTLTKHRPPTATDDDVASAVQRNAPVLAAEPVVKAAEKQLLPLRKAQRQLAAMPRTAEIDQALDDNRKAQDAIMKQSLTVLHQMRASGR
jgi:hypothetical protein